MADGTLPPTPVAPGSPNSHLALRILGTLGAVVMALYLWPVLPALMVSAVAAALVRPIQRKGEDRLVPPGLMAFVNTLGVFLLVLLPLTGLSVLIGREAAAGIRWLESEAPSLLGPGSRLDLLAKGVLARIGLPPVELSPVIAEQLQQMASLLAARTVSFVSGLGGWLLQAGVALFTLYYFLKDARAVEKGITMLLPLDEHYTRRLLERARDVTYATVVGNLLVAVVQGLLGGLAFWAVGLPSPALWGTLMGVLSLVPVVGPPVVWIPGAIHLFSTGSVGRAVGLSLFGFLVIGTVDNLLRTWLVSGRIKVHPLLVFLGLVGGIFLFGAAGAVVGPVVFVVALALAQQARSPDEPEETGDEGDLLIEVPDDPAPEGPKPVTETP
ncbi:MAG: AI-2E family transporter [Gemmatimonadales bacterium]|nr:MAG: AI-2E family transporter [Gemmatimonadales bacterium]